jgi:sugar transferase (PEP-CTERM system associated)
MPWLLVGSDICLVALGLLVGTFLRFAPGGSAWENLASADTLSRFAQVIIACELALYFNGLYDLEVVRDHSTLLVRLVQALGFAGLALAISYYFNPRLSLGRGIMALSAPLILTLLAGLRLVLHRGGLSLVTPRRVLVVGTGEAGISLAREICQRPELGLKVIGFLDEKGENLGKPLVNPGIIGGIDDLREIVAREEVNQLVLSMVERRARTPTRELLDLKFSGIRIEDAHTFHERLMGKIVLDNLSPSWLILSDGFRKSAFLLAAKRTVDCLVSILVLLSALPLMPLIALAIWLESGSPVLFRQVRIGFLGRPFQILKFRSMYRDAESDGPRWATEGDKRVTRVGRLLRKFRLDELPQLFNVLRGEMSLVGPRPEQPYFCAVLEDQIPYFGQRHAVRPGITGWAQIRYPYGSSVKDARAKLELDLYYIKNLSIMLDMTIMVETAKVVLRGHGAN